MDALIGSWMAMVNTPVTLNFSYFEIPPRAVISCVQVDPERHKVLLQFGPNCTGWLHESFLNTFEKLI